MLISDQLAQSEAVIGRLPPDCSIVQSLRDYIIVSIQLTSSTKAIRQVILVVADADRDLRVLWVLGSLVKFNRETCSRLVALAESKGKVRSWWTAHPIPMLGHVDTNDLQAASDMALAPDDRWVIAPPIFLKVKPDGAADLDSLPENDDLRRMAPRSHALGKVVTP